MSQEASNLNLRLFFNLQSNPPRHQISPVAPLITLAPYWKQVIKALTWSNRNKGESQEKTKSKEGSKRNTSASMREK